MAKAYTLTGYSAAPTLSLALAAGGTLSPNTTYYYRAMTAQNWSGGGAYVSALSTVQSITTDTTNLSVDITITHSTGNAEYTYIWVMEGSDPGTGNWALTNGVYMLNNGNGSTSVVSSNYNTKITSYTDTGARYNYLSIGSSNYGMYIPHEQARHQIAVSGGTSGDPVTLEDIYQYALANSWVANETITRLDTLSVGAGDDDGIAKTGAYGAGRPTYVINAQTLAYSDYFQMKDQNVLSFTRDFYGTTNSVINIGEYSSTYDLSKNGIDYTNYVHSSERGGLSFRNARIYDSKFRARRLAKSVATPYKSTFSLTADSGSTFEIIDCDVASEYDRGMALAFVSGSGTNNIIKRVKHYENRWETNTYQAPQGVVSDWKFFIANSGPWIRTSTTENLAYSIRNMTVVLAGGSRTHYVTPKYTGTSYYTMMTLINPVIAESAYDELYWFMSGSLVDDTAYLDRAYTFIQEVVDENGDAISGATVTLVDDDGTQVFSETTDANGLIDEQTVVHTRYQCSDTLTTSHFQTSGRTTYYGPWVLTVSKTGYETYEEEIVIDAETNKSVSLRSARKLRKTTEGKVVFALGAEKGTDSLLQPL